MGKRIPLFRGTSGLNTMDDPAELVHDLETGEIELSRAVNVHIERTGRRISRRKGTVRKVSGSFHSGFAGSTGILCVQEHTETAALYRVNSDYTLTGLRDDLTRFRHMSYAEANGRIYYANGRENGYVENGGSFAWLRSEYVGHVTDKELFDPPVGHHLAVMGGYMLIAEDNVLWVSEEFDYSAFNLANRYMDLIDRIVMVRVVNDGVWVATQSRTFFLSGLEPEKWAIAVTVPYGVQEYSSTEEAVPESRIGIQTPQGIQGNGYLWLSDRGVCWGGPGGQFINLTERKIDPADLAGNIAAAGLFDDRIVFTIEP